MDKKKFMVTIISVIIGAVFLYFGFSGMLQKRAAEEKAAAIENTIVKKNITPDSSDGLDNLGE